MSNDSANLALSQVQVMARSRTRSTVISRREIEPLIVKAHRLMAWYKKATGCEVCVLNAEGFPVDISSNKKTYPFCELCKSCLPEISKTGQDGECTCTQIHKQARQMADRGGSYIYVCKAGFSYLTSPLYAGLRFAGSLTAGQVLTISREQAIKQIHSLCRIPKEQIEHALLKIPLKTHEEIQSMAGLLMVCAVKLSLHPRRHAHTMRRKTSGKKTTETTLPFENTIKDRLHHKDKERMLLAALRRGDMKAVHKHLDELFNIIREDAHADFDVIRFRVIELAASLSRSTENIDRNENFDRCFRRIQESLSMEELRENLTLYIEHIGTTIFSFRGLRHACALRKAERFIWENYTRRISLNEIAAASGLSAPYFSSIFKEERGINLSSYLNQLRVEKAAGLLEETGFTLNEIAKECGFEDQNWFSKIFKSRMGTSPGKFREKGNSKN